MNADAGDRRRCRAWYFGGRLPWMRISTLVPFGARYRRCMIARLRSPFRSTFLHPVHTRTSLTAMTALFFLVQNTNTLLSTIPTPLCHHYRPFCTLQLCMTSLTTCSPSSHVPANLMASFFGPQSFLLFHDGTQDGGSDFDTAHGLVGCMMDVEHQADPSRGSWWVLTAGGSLDWDLDWSTCKRKGRLDGE